MSRLLISLFGKPQIALDGVPILIPKSRAFPIIAYLAISGKSESRETLANLLWAESNQKHALAALRTTLWRLKSAGLEDWITFDRNEIELKIHKSIDIDVLNFRLLLEKCSTHGHPSSQVCLYCTPALTEAVNLYHGDFMSGFNISKAPNFDDWRMQQSENLQSLHLDALERLVKCHRTFGDFNLAIHYARLWLRHDRLNETANYQLLQLYSITGQRTAGISLYKQYKEVLSRELGIEPPDELTAFYKQIQSGQATPLSNQRTKNPIFLIAEVENISEYWARVGSKKDELLSNRLNMLRDTARRFGGRILQRSDENLTMLFENGQPLHFVVTMYMKTQKFDWGAAGPPSIRCVIYSTGVDDDLPRSFSELTLAASSLLSITWGGQVVFSEQTLRSLDMPSGSSVRDLGFHLLEAGERMVHVYELVHPNLPQRDHPPLRSRAQQLVNLPILSPAFIGREQELADLDQLIKSPENRVISLVGPGGIGKTRLAVQFASQAMEYFPDGVYFISLASIQDPEFIPILLAEALKFSFYGPKNHTEQLGRYLHRMKLLFVIDNFEHMRVEGAKILASILTQTHHLKVIVTTRERLNMIAETILEVHGLPFPANEADDDAENYSSVRLFINNAKKSSPRFSSKENLPAVSRICKQVAGIPLGILLASSWVRVFSCFEIASEIKQNIDFLSSTAPDIDPRHRSLRAVFDHSWELLSEDERRILRRLSIFTSPFTSDAAYKICASTPLLLATLSDKSLLYFRQEDRYEMLATFQQYAAGKLAENPDELEQTRAKFCDYYADLCLREQTKINSSKQASALSEMTAEIENIRTAWSILVDAGRWDVINKIKDPVLAYHVMLGNIIPGGELFKLAIARLNRLKDPNLALIHASMLQFSAWMTAKSGFIAEGIQGLNESLERFRQCNSPWDIALTLMFLCEASRIRGDKSLSKAYIEEALQILRSEAVPTSNYILAVTAHCQADLGITLMEMGELALAHQNLLESLATHRQLGTHYGTITPLMGLARLAYTQGEFIQSKDLFLQALETATKIYDRRGMALIHNNLGAVYEEIVNISESYHHVTSALKFCRETGDRRLTAVILNNLAFHQMKYLHQPAEAIRTYQECIELFHEIGDLRGITYTCYDLSRTYLMVGLVEEGWNYCLRSLHTAMTVDNPTLILHALHGFVNIFIHLKKYERALRLCNLIIAHPETEQDTQKRAIVSRAELEIRLSPEAIDSASAWSESASLTDTIDQILTESKSLRI